MVNQQKINNHYSSPMLHPTNKSTRITSWWFQPNWKILVKLDHFPRVRGGNKKYLSCHHLDHHTKNCSPATQHCIGDFLSLTDLIEQGLPRGLDPVGWQGLEGGLQVCRLRTIRWKVPTNWWGFSWESKSNLFEICLDDIYLNSMSSLVILGGWGLWERKAAYRNTSLNSMSSLMIFAKVLRKSDEPPGKLTRRCLEYPPFSK